MERAVIRFCDLALSAAGLVVLGIPMMGIALWIRAEDGGPALFRQERVGRARRPFTIYKFRTMRVPDLTQRGTQSIRTDPGDSRITRVGKILRPLHLDELPQLLNVIAGDMSLVGVRPDTPVQESDYDPAFWVSRHTERPGLTGPAQLLPNDITFAQRNAQDTWWTEHYNVRNYALILLRTFAKVARRNSY